MNPGKPPLWSSTVVIIRNISHIIALVIAHTLYIRRSQKKGHVRFPVLRHPALRA